MRLGHMGASVDDWDLVNLLYLKSSHDAEIVWLVSYYVLYVWETVHVRKREVNLEPSDMSNYLKMAGIWPKKIKFQV